MPPEQRIVFKTRAFATFCSAFLGVILVSWYPQQIQPGARDRRNFIRSYPHATWFASRMSPPIILCTLKTAPRKQRAWDIVDIKEATPTPVYYEYDLDIIRISSQSITGQYIFEMMHTEYHCRQAVRAARLQLLHEIKKDSYNVLLGEGWKLTQMRKGNLLRIMVVYSGRPAVASGDVHSRVPPFLEVLGEN
ncbi:hypothetical protein FRC12_015552 [Ceratobasidium sp. 428]|nr:hypothetical protein FRC12_015552 [Ceratobasidium sp. 428]